jgi:glycerophosphoryl diester phosphodiesterase
VRYEGLEAAVLGRLRAHGLETRTTLMAFNPAVVTELRRQAPDVRVTLLAGANHLALSQLSMAEMLEFAASLGVSDLGIEHTLVTADVVADAHRRRLALGAWTVNDADEIRRCAAAGVDVVTSDRPDLALEALA